MQQNQPILITAANGKTGRRIATLLEERGQPVRRASRSAAVPFDWEQPATWQAALSGARAAYVAYIPDLAVPAALEAIRTFVRTAKEQGVQRLVLLSGRGEPEARACERLVQQSGLEWTIVRASWFAQNFDEGAFLDGVLGGRVALPAGGVREPFIDADDIAEVAAAALLEGGHAGEVYEVTGPRLMTFAEAIREIAEAAGRPVALESISMGAFKESLANAGVPADYVELLDYLFTITQDGRNAQLTDGVQRALGRSPRDFSQYARAAAARGAWASS